MPSRIPLPGVVVTVSGVSMTTGVDGQYAFSPVRDGDVLLTGKRQGFLNFSQVVPVTGARTFDVPMTVADLAKIAGNWSGVWSTTTLNRTDTVTLSVVVNTVAEAVTVALDVNGNLVDDYNPPADVFPGVLTSAGAVRISRVSPTYGTVAVDVTPEGRITGSATRIPFGTATRFDFTGTISATATTVTYTITFADGTTARGSATLTKGQL